MDSVADDYARISSPAVLHHEVGQFTVNVRAGAFVYVARQTTRVNAVGRNFWFYEPPGPVYEFCPGIFWVPTWRFRSYVVLLRQLHYAVGFDL